MNDQENTASAESTAPDALNAPVGSEAPSQADGGAGEPATTEEQDELAKEEGSADQYQSQIRDVEERKAAFRKELFDLVEKYQIAPDAHNVYSQHGVKTGVVLIDLKYAANVDVNLPTFEEEQAMHAAMIKAFNQNKK